MYALTLSRNSREKVEKVACVITWDYNKSVRTRSLQRCEQESFSEVSVFILNSFPQHIFLNVFFSFVREFCDCFS